MIHVVATESSPPDVSIYAFYLCGVDPLDSYIVRLGSGCRPVVRSGLWIYADLDQQADQENKSDWMIEMCLGVVSNISLISSELPGPKEPFLLSSLPIT